MGKSVFYRPLATIALLLVMTRIGHAQTFSDNDTVFTDPLTNSADPYMTFSDGSGGSVSYSNAGATLTSANSSSPNSVGLNFSVTDPNTGNPISITGDFTASFNFSDLTPNNSPFEIGLTTGASINENYYFNGFSSVLQAGVPTAFSEGVATVSAGTFDISRVDGVVSYSFDGNVFGTETNSAPVDYISLGLYQALAGDNISATFSNANISGLTATPEPGTMPLAGLGGAGGLLLFYRRKSGSKLLVFNSQPFNVRCRSTEENEN
jgi:hypothetical protein